MVKKQHIINYENIIINTYKFRKEYNECIWNGYGLDDIPIIIKLINNKSSINIGNIFKYEEITTDFILHIGFWDINEHSNKIYKNITLYIKKDKWNELFNFDNIKEKKHI